MWSNPCSEQDECKSGCSWQCPLRFGIFLRMEILDSVAELSKVPEESADLGHSVLLAFTLRC